MDNSLLQTIRDLISKNDQVAIAVGKNPNLDEMGGALALYLYLKSQNKKVTIASPTQPVVEISSLVGIDKVKSTLSQDGGDLVVSFPYRDDEIQKVSYTLEGGFLNIIVKAGDRGLSFSEKDVQFKRGGGAPSLLFIVGTPRLSDLGPLFDPDALKETTVVNIDNKVNNQGFGDVVFVSPRFSSVSEQVADLLLSLDENIDLDIAQNLLSGVSFATNNFQDPKASVTAFEMAARLMKKGAVRPELHSKQPQDSSSFFQPVKSNEPNRDFRNQGRQRFEPQTQDQQKQQARFPQQQQRSQQQQQPFQRQQQPSSNQVSGQEEQQNVKQQPKDDKKDDEAPSDWLTPKVYKSSNLL